MNNKQAESNIFDSVVSEPVINAETNTVLVLNLVVLVVPVTDDALKGNGLNQ